MVRRLGLIPSVMSKSRCNRGFTLVELLVVILIIGLTLGFAVLKIDSSEDEALNSEARRFAALARLAAEEAVLQSQELAVELTPSGYAFVALGAEGWKPVEADDGVFRPRELPAEMTLNGELNGEPIAFVDEEDEPKEGEEPPPKPRIFFFSSGEMTPFTLDFRRDFGNAYQVTGDYMGEVKVATAQRS